MERNFFLHDQNDGDHKLEILKKNLMAEKKVEGNWFLEDADNPSGATILKISC